MSEAIAPSSLLARGVGTLLPPAIRRVVWRSFYGLLVRLSRRGEAEFTCMNWGYADPGADFPDDLGEERYPLQLYLALVDGVDLSGAEIAEISCGRGGGLAEVLARSDAANAVGVDLTPGNIGLCRERFADRPSLSFQVGDAMDLPFDDASLDALLSVEASHCYPSDQRFVAEAARVLRPGGHLLWTDWRPSDEMFAIDLARDAGFEVIRERDVAANVLLAMSKDGPRRQAMIASAGPPWLERFLTFFAAADGETPIVRSFASGERVYFMAQLRR